MILQCSVVAVYISPAKTKHHAHLLLWDTGPCPQIYSQAILHFSEGECSFVLNVNLSELPHFHVSGHVKKRYNHFYVTDNQYMTQAELTFISWWDVYAIKVIWGFFFFKNSEALTYEECDFRVPKNNGNSFN